jgi:hypothetical protein
MRNAVLIVALGAVLVAGCSRTGSTAAIACVSQPAAMTCADGSTGHYFRISRKAYEVG